MDRAIHLGRPYFYSVTAVDHAFHDDTGGVRRRQGGRPGLQLRLRRTAPARRSRTTPYAEDEVYVVPNPATDRIDGAVDALAQQRRPDRAQGRVPQPAPADRGTIRIFTLAGDLVEEIAFDGTPATERAWDLVSRNGQDVTSGVYLFSVETQNNNFERTIGKFVVIR